MTALYADAANPSSRPDAYVLPTYEELRRWLTATPANPWPTVDDRAAWEALARTPYGAGIREAALADAEEMAATPGVRNPTLTEFLLWTRTGDRRTWEDASDEPARRVDAFTLAACFTGEERWVDRAADALWAICEMTTWTTPAHEGKTVPDPDDPYVDLYSAMRAHDLAEALQLLGPALDRIDSRIARRVRVEIRRRVLTPFLQRGDWWWLFPQPNRPRLNNWTAVCSGSVLCAALAVLNDDPDLLTRTVYRAAWSLAFFKETFEAGGSLDEGAGYWSYGVSYFAMAAERLAARTGGRVDPLADPLWEKVAAFPLAVRLYDDRFVNFSDCAPSVVPAPGWLSWLGRRMGNAGLTAWAEEVARRDSPGYGDRHRYLSFALRTLVWTGDVPAEPDAGTTAESASTAASLPLATYLPDVQWMVARSDAGDDALILAAKGGHNDENHNHNDGGSFLVHWRQEPLVAELGSPTYNRFFFSSARYDNLAARSLGHSVPFVNGREQVAGRERAARNVRFTHQNGEAALTLDLAGFYGPEARLESLVRRVALVAATGDAPAAVRLTDAATFTGDGNTLALPLITLDCLLALAGPGEAEIVGSRDSLRVTWNPAQATARLEDVDTEDVKFLTPDGQTRVRRLWLDVNITGRQAELTLTLTPGEA
jgi:hypothetical protein